MALLTEQSAAEEKLVLFIISDLIRYGKSGKQMNRG